MSASPIIRSPSFVDDGAEPAEFDAIRNAAARFIARVGQRPIGVVMHERSSPHGHGLRGRSRGGAQEARSGRGKSVAREPGDRRHRDGGARASISQARLFPRSSSSRQSRFSAQPMLERARRAQSSTAVRSSTSWSIDPAAGGGAAAFTPRDGGRTPVGDRPDTRPVHANLRRRVLSGGAGSSRGSDGRRNAHSICRPARRGGDHGRQARRPLAGRARSWPRRPVMGPRQPQSSPSRRIQNRRRPVLTPMIPTGGRITFSALAIALLACGGGCRRATRRGQTRISRRVPFAAPTSCSSPSTHFAPTAWARTEAAISRPRSTGSRRKDFDSHAPIRMRR